MFKSVLLISVVAICGLASAEEISFGSCPEGIQVVSDFQVEKYLGTWHEQARYPFLFEKDGKCNTATYSLDTDRVRVNNSMINEKTGLFQDAIGQAKLISSGKLEVGFEVSAFFTPESNYWVLDTDYTSYTCVYSCRPLPLSHITYAWIMTREQKPSEKVIQKCEDVFTRNNVSLEPFEKVVQTGC